MTSNSKIKLNKKLPARLWKKLAGEMSQDCVGRPGTCSSWFWLANILNEGRTESAARNDFCVFQEYFARCPKTHPRPVLFFFSSCFKSICLFLKLWCSHSELALPSVMSSRRDQWRKPSLTFCQCSACCKDPGGAQWMLLAPSE